MMKIDWIDEHLTNYLYQFNYHFPLNMLEEVMIQLNLKGLQISHNFLAVLMNVCADIHQVYLL